MGKPYSSDLRQRFVAALDKACRPARLAAACGSRARLRPGGPPHGGVRVGRRRCRWAGTPCVGAVPRGRWRNNTFIAGLRSNRINAPMLIEGAIDGDAFCAWVEEMLAPTLAAGDIVICDNVSVHKTAKARVRSATARCADSLCTAITSDPAAFTPRECARYLRRSGYASP